ncbi:MAG: hypothetical protein AB2672_03715 [Candidatus Thiodiazotropha endolucinida]
MAYQPDLAVQQAEAYISAFVEVARDIGLEHIVLLSGWGEAGAQWAEMILMSSGLPWNTVRSSWFFQNFSEGFMLDEILAVNLSLPAGDAVEPFIDVDDIADVTVAVLTEPKLTNRVFEVFGPRAMTFAQCMAELSYVLGHHVRYTQDAADCLRCHQWVNRHRFLWFSQHRNRASCHCRCHQVPDCRHRHSR